jgi:hypothetical protein
MFQFICQFVVSLNLQVFINSVFIFNFFTLKELIFVFFQARLKIIFLILSNQASAFIFAFISVP